MNKKYTDFMDEISSDELYEGLLAYGFFAEKLPPVFTAVSFFNYCKTVSVPFDAGWKEVNLSCAIGDDLVDGMPYEEIVKIAKDYIDSIGGFEKFAEWGLIR